MAEIPLLIEFASPSTVLREAHRGSDLPIVSNGPPGTFIVFPDGLRVSLPTDQIVFADDTDGYARVGFGGMHYVGLEGGRLTFKRVREVLPAHELSPGRSHTMYLDPRWLTAVFAGGLETWRRAGTGQ